MLPGTCALCMCATVLSVSWLTAWMMVTELLLISLLAYLRASIYLVFFLSPGLPSLGLLLLTSLPSLLTGWIATLLITTWISLAANATTAIDPFVPFRKPFVISNIVLDLAFVGLWAYIATLTTSDSFNATELAPLLTAGNVLTSSCLLLFGLATLGTGIRLVQELNSAPAKSRFSNRILRTSLLLGLAEICQCIFGLISAFQASMVLVVLGASCDLLGLLAILMLFWPAMRRLQTKSNNKCCGSKKIKKIKKLPKVSVPTHTRSRTHTHPHTTSHTHTYHHTSPPAEGPAKDCSGKSKRKAFRARLQHQRVYIWAGYPVFVILLAPSLYLVICMCMCMCAFVYVFFF